MLIDTVQQMNINDMHVIDNKGWRLPLKVSHFQVVQVSNSEAYLAGGISQQGTPQTQVLRLKIDDGKITSESLAPLPEPLPDFKLIYNP